jgi:hypothetical protein
VKGPARGFIPFAGARRPPLSPVLRPDIERRARNSPDQAGVRAFLELCASAAPFFDLRRRTCLRAWPSSPTTERKSPRGDEHGMENAVKTFALDTFLRG